MMSKESRQVICPTPSTCSAIWNSLKSEAIISCTGLSGLTEANSSLPRSSSLILAMRARRSAMEISRLVQVGDLNITVSDRMAAAISPAMGPEGMTPCS